MFDVQHRALMSDAVSECDVKAYGIVLLYNICL